MLSPTAVRILAPLASPSSLIAACSFPMDTPAVLLALLFVGGHTKYMVWGVKVIVVVMAIKI